MQASASDHPFKIGDTALWFNGRLGAEAGVSVIVTGIVHYEARPSDFAEQYEVVLDGDVCPTQAGPKGGLASSTALRPREKSAAYETNVALWPLRLAVLESKAVAAENAAFLAQAEHNAVAYAHIIPGTKVWWTTDYESSHIWAGTVVIKDIARGTCAIQVADRIYPAVDIAWLKVSACSGCGDMTRGGCLVFGSCGGDSG